MSIGDRTAFAIKAVGLLGDESPEELISRTMAEAGEHIAEMAPGELCPKCGESHVPEDATPQEIRQKTQQAATEVLGILAKIREQTPFKSPQQVVADMTVLLADMFLEAKQNKGVVRIEANELIPTFLLAIRALMAFCPGPDDPQEVVN